MSDSFNIGAALLILGCFYFDYAYGFNWWLLPFILLGVFSWAYAGFTSERKDYWNAQIEYYRAKAEYYRRKMAGEGR